MRSGLRIRLTVAVLSVCAFGACATRTHGLNNLGVPCSVATPQLNADWREWNDLVQTPAGCEFDGGQRCEILRQKILRLATDCPTNRDVLIANALLAFERRDFVRTQQLLDELSALGESLPEAIMLRARIALREGNAPFAIRLLAREIHRTGDHAGLRETYASALYLAAHWDEALAQLGIAKELGAPAWRIAYSQALILEAAARFEEARAAYELALRERPNWKPAESRLRGLLATHANTGGKTPVR